jgi:hypothetical protein
MRVCLCLDSASALAGNWLSRLPGHNVSSHVCPFLQPVSPTAPGFPQVYSAGEAFVTGTFAGQIPVKAVDGRAIGSGRRGPVVQRLQQLYKELCDSEAAGGRVAVDDCL